MRDTFVLANIVPAGQYFVGEFLPLWSGFKGRSTPQNAANCTPFRGVDRRLEKLYVPSLFRDVHRGENPRRPSKSKVRPLLAGFDATAGACP